MNSTYAAEEIQEWFNANKSRLFDNTKFNEKGLFVVNAERTKILFINYDKLINSSIYKVITDISPMSKLIIDSTGENEDVIALLMYKPSPSPPSLQLININ